MIAIPVVLFLVLCALAIARQKMIAVAGLLGIIVGVYVGATNAGPSVTGVVSSAFGLFG
jgi:succinate-acetate transporter protein